MPGGGREEKYRSSAEGAGNTEAEGLHAALLRSHGEAQQPAPAGNVNEIHF